MMHFVFVSIFLLQVIPSKNGRPGWSTNKPALILLTALSFFYVGCGTDKDEIIRQMVDEKVQSFRQTEMTACRLRMLEDAERTVDSILLAEAKAEVLDSLNRARPLRPPLPIPQDPIDSAEVRPIFIK